MNYGQHVGWLLAMQAACQSGALMLATAGNRVALVRGEIDRGSNPGVGSVFSAGVEAGRALQAKDLAGLDALSKKDACERLPRIERRFITTGEVLSPSSRRR